MKTFIWSAGFVHSSYRDHVCLSSYGLKQAPRQWFTHCLSFWQLLNSSNQKLDSIINRLSNVFPIKDLSPLHYLLGIQVHKQPIGLLLTQQKYLEGLLYETTMQNCKPCITLMPTMPTLTKNMGTPLPDPAPYPQIVGALWYLTHSDIAFHINKLSQFMHSAIDVHWQAIKPLLLYLRGTSSKELFISKNSDMQLHCFSYSDWAGCSHRRSTDGYVVYIDQNLVSLSSKKDGCSVMFSYTNNQSD